MAATPPENRLIAPRSANAVPACNGLAIGAITRQQLAADFSRVRAATEALTGGLTGEDQGLQSMPSASPVKWHRAHTTWFFEAFVLTPHDPAWRRLDPAWNYLFNSYYHGIGAQFPRPQRGLISRPDVTEIAAWRRRVDQAVLNLIERTTGTAWPALASLIRLGLNHEQQHQELIVTDLKHALACNPLYPAWTDLPSPARHAPAALGWVDFDAQVADIGAADNGLFCYDNEMPRHRQAVAAFKLAARPVTCGEYLEFLEDGGYDDPRLWLADGWAWLGESGTRAPLYWQQDDSGSWQHYTLGGLRKIDPHEALAHVSFYEADAYARWAQARLPTEAEWEVAAAAAGGPPGPMADDGRFHPASSEPGSAGNRLAALFGNVWEWTASSYLPYPGFRAAEGAVGEYNGKFMANQMVLRGGSCATPAGHIRATYRNFFYPPDRWQFSGIRLARDR